MTLEEGRIKFNELINNAVIEKEELRVKLEKEGRYVSGLDTNREAYKEINEKYDKKYRELVAMLDIPADKK